MIKEKKFKLVFFKENVIREAITSLLQGKSTEYCSCSVGTEEETWTYDNLEDFFKDYSRSPDSASITIRLGGRFGFHLYYALRNTSIEMEAKDYKLIHSIFDIFEKQRETSGIAPTVSSYAIFKGKYYKNTFFSAEVIKEASELFSNLLDPERKEDKHYYLNVDMGEEEWEYDNPEDFFNEYRKSPYKAYYSIGLYDSSLNDSYLKIGFSGPGTNVRVQARNRATILKIFDIFEKYKTLSKIPKVLSFPKLELKIFIGHGRNPLWKELKDHLHEKHGYDIEAYEIGARAGHSIRDILESMLKESTFALLVMTGENKATGKQLRARDNVIHELGLFQGKLGFNRAIVLLEKGTKEFSNIEGIQQIRFKKGNIKEAFGEILATINREFPKSSK